MLDHILKTLNDEPFDSAVCNYPANIKQFSLTSGNKVKMILVNPFAHMSLEFQGDSVGVKQLTNFMGHRRGSTTGLQTGEFTFPNDVQLGAMDESVGRWSSDGSPNWADLIDRADQVPYTLENYPTMTFKITKKPLQGAIVTSQQRITSSEFNCFKNIMELVQFCFPLMDHYHIDQSVRLGLDTNTTQELSFQIEGLGDESFLADTLGLGDGEKSKVTLTAENPTHTFSQPVNTKLFLDGNTCMLSDILKVKYNRNQDVMQIRMKSGNVPGTSSTVVNMYGWSYVSLSIGDGDVQGHVSYNHPFKDLVSSTNNPALVVSAGDLSGMNDSDKRAHFQNLIEFKETLTERNEYVSLNISIAKQLRLQDNELAVYQNKVRLRLGWKSSDNQATILFSETRDLSAPGSYGNLEVFLKELYATFQFLILPSTSGKYTVDLCDLLDIIDRESVHRAHFRLKLKATTPGPKINYLELTINPRMCVMLGLLPSTANIEEAQYLTSKTVALVGNVNLSDANKSIVPEVPIPEMKGPFTVNLADSTTNTFTAPNRLNMNLGITSMYIYMPDIVERSNLGQSSLAHLATVPIQGKPNERVHHSIINPIVRKLVQDKVEEIPVEILDHEGNRIKFTSSINAVSLECKIQSFDRIK